MAEYATRALLQRSIRPQDMRGQLDAETWWAVYNGRTLYEGVAGKAISVVGLGRIGQRMAR